MRDVAIVGGGPVGLLLACLLAQRGVDVAVFEHREAIAPRARAFGIHPPGLAMLDEAGVGRAARAEAVPIRDGVALRGRTGLGRLAFDPPVLSVPQHRVEALLETRLHAIAPGALQRGTAVLSARHRTHRFEVGLRRGDAETTTSEEARYLVAADGVHGIVPGRVGIGRRQRRGAAHYVMADAPDTTGMPDRAVLHFEPDGVVESFPAPGGLRRWVVRHEPPGVLDARAFAALVNARVGAGLDPAATSEPSGFAARQGLADRFARGRVALVGDAAHEISPIGGQGMNLGWIDAGHLAAAIVAALADGAPGAPFEAYAAARRRAAARAIRRASFNMAMGAPARGVVRGGRDAATRVLATAPFRGILTGAFTMRGL